mmetsp:Transcript_32365/g.84029  ORF Transcript_32365/g.84029 Transcript_32365/m.84029 type:complete len:211 (-) Transcript_32365:54-686(-)
MVASSCVFSVMGNVCFAGLRRQVSDLQRRNDELRADLVELERQRSGASPSRTRQLQLENVRLREEANRAAQQLKDLADCKIRRRGVDEVVVVVDPSSSVRHIIGELAKQMWPLVGLRSSAGKGVPWGPADEKAFEKVFEHSCQIDTLRLLSDYEVVTVLPGCAAGVPLAEELRQALGLDAFGVGGAGQEGDPATFEMVRRTTFDMLSQAV